MTADRKLLSTFRRLVITRAPFSRHWVSRCENVKLNMAFDDYVCTCTVLKIMYGNYNYLVGF